MRIESLYYDPKMSARVFGLMNTIVTHIWFNGHEIHFHDLQHVLVNGNNKRRRSRGIDQAY